MRTWMVIPLIGASALLAATASQAAPQKVTASLTGSAETPPNTSDGTGALTGTYDPDTKTLSYTVTYKGLSGPATMAHFHAPAPTGKAAPVEIPITGSVESPIHGDIKLDDQQIKNLTDGMTYFNVHTKKNEKGEIRGQVLLVN